MAKQKPKTIPSAGIRLYYAALGSSPDTQLSQIKNYPDLPGEPREEYEDTRADQMDGEEIDWTKYFEPSYQDPGTTTLTLGGDEDQIDIAYGMRDDGLHRSWKILFSTG